MLKFFDLVDLLERQRNVVQSFKEAFAAEFINFEARLKTAGVGNGKRFQVDRELILVLLGYVLVNRFDLLGRQSDGQDAVLGAVIVKDVCERLGNHATKTKIIERPNGVFAAGAVAEILASYEY